MSAFASKHKALCNSPRSMQCNYLSHDARYYINLRGASAQPVSKPLLMTSCSALPDFPELPAIYTAPARHIPRPWMGRQDHEVGGCPAITEIATSSEEACENRAQVELGALCRIVPGDVLGGGTSEGQVEKSSFYISFSFLFSSSRISLIMTPIPEDLA